jgi:hypothetical protein
VEGIAAIAVVFVLFTVMVQAATALMAHRTAQSAVAASATRVAISPATATDEAARLERAVAALVPGSGRPRVSIAVGPGLVTATAGFEFTPPGPMLRTIEMEVSARAPVVVEP